MGGSLISLLRWPREMGLATMLPYALRGWLQLRTAVRRWPERLLDHPVVDSVLWSVVTAVESVALVSMVCAFFFCCGCTF